MRKLTWEFVNEEFTKRGYKLVSKEYSGVGSKLSYECPFHKGQPNSIRYKDLKRGVGCRYCGQEKRDAPRRIPYNTVKKAFNDKGYTLVSETYTNAHTPLKFICPEHPDKETEMTYSSIRIGRGCKYCAGVGKHSIEEVREEFRRRGYTLLTEEYINGIEKLEYMCPEHPEFVNEIIYQNFRNSNQGCPHCAGNQKYTIDQAEDMFRESGYELLETEYVGKDKPMRFRCPNHSEKETFMSLSSIRMGRKCQLCSIDSQKGEGHPRYDATKTLDERVSRRFLIGYPEWRSNVFIRDKYTCTVCADNKGGNLVAHHKDGYGWCVDRRLDDSNGITLCNTCHKDFHTEYGYKDNTEAQYDEWLTKKEEIK